MIGVRTDTQAPEPEPEYRSPRCVIGGHDRCLDSAPRDSGVPGVRYLRCECFCHGSPPALTRGT
ncbi:hypothetical protein [Streptomyces exfoliatus]|uniref:hypothetical protein n=1 Tax=Streptomyces exfoliatus TaxID=1905 RepID=UPI000467BF87|nr:hypothetical protein [Streptomyces exfoliatus]